MLRSLSSAVSGLDANQEMIDTIGNDIANVNTTGYKSSSVEFEDLLSQTIAGATAPSSGQGGVNPTQVGLGVKVAGIETNFTQGNSEQTGNPLDLAIQGDGFFICNANGQTYYTRAGSLQLDANGDLTTPDGYLVQGWAADAKGNINTSAPLTNLAIPSGQSIGANATQNINLAGNLAPQSGWTDPDSSASGPGTSTSVTVYAPNGSTETLSLVFTEGSAGPTSWNVYGALITPGSTTAPTYSSIGTLSFNSDGTLASGNTLPLKFSPTSGTTININFTDSSGNPTVTAYSGDDTLSVASQDGNASGTLQSYSIGSNGVIQGVFSNGQTKDLGQIALATFANPDGLLRAGDTDFTATANSGLAQIGTPGNANWGTIEAGTLESSNVDLGTELTELIEGERGFQANSSVITTSDQLLQTLISMNP
ncbi:MAG: flagellar hook protein FlgE [Acidimicrobiales bacterium]